MFTRRPTVINVNAPTRTEYVTREVHEHRAPTDQSVALLREMEQAARDKVEQSINVGGNGFECVVNVAREAMSNDTVARAVFSLNGKRMTAEARVSGWKKDAASELPTALRDAVAKEIATEMVGPAIAAAWRT